MPTLFLADERLPDFGPLPLGQSGCGLREHLHEVPDLGLLGRKPDVRGFAFALPIRGVRGDERFAVAIENGVPGDAAVLVALDSLADILGVLVAADVELDEDEVTIQLAFPRLEESAQLAARSAPGRGGDEEDSLVLRLRFRERVGHIFSASRWGSLCLARKDASASSSSF